MCRFLLTHTMTEVRRFSPAASQQNDQDQQDQDSPDTESYM